MLFIIVRTIISTLRSHRALALETSRSVTNSLSYKETLTGLD
jgi:hypothetical protein